jgi:hypothetical protein
VFWVFVSIPAIYPLQSLRWPTHCPDDRALRRHTPYPSTLDARFFVAEAPTLQLADICYSCSLHSVILERGWRHPARTPRLDSSYQLSELSGTGSTFGSQSVSWEELLMIFSALLCREAWSTRGMHKSRSICSESDVILESESRPSAYINCLVTMFLHIAWHLPYETVNAGCTINPHPFFAVINQPVLTAIFIISATSTHR